MSSYTVVYLTGQNTKQSKKEFYFLFLILKRKGSNRAGNKGVFKVFLFIVNL